MYIRKVTERHLVNSVRVALRVLVQIIAVLFTISAIPRLTYAAVPAGTTNPSCGPLDTSCVVATDSYDAGIAIGTSTPTSVLGRLYSPSPGALFWNGSQIGGISTSTFVNGGNAFSGFATIGTTNAQPLRIISSSTEAMRIIQSGFIGIGVSTPAALLSVGASGAVPYINMGNNSTPAPYNASASSEMGISNQAFKAFDSQLATAWIVQDRFSTSTGAWLMLDYGAAFYADGAEILSANNESPTDWRIEGSNDNSTWSTLYEQHTPLSSINTVVAFTNSGVYRYYRLFIIAANNDFPKIANFKITSSVSSGISAKFNGAVFASEAKLLSGGLMIASSSPTSTANLLFNQSGVLRWGGQSFLTASESTAPVFTLTTNTTPTPYRASASSEKSGLLQAWNAFDDNDATYWTTSIEGANFWLKIDLGAAYYADGAIVNARDNLNSQPMNWRIEGSVDDLTWETLYADAGAMSTSSTELKLSSPGTYRYFRMFSASSTGGPSPEPGMDTFKITSSVPSGIYSILKKSIAIPGLLAQRNGITIASSTPSSTVSTLYALGSSLYWNGALLTTASSGIFQLNGISSSTQSFAVGTSGGDFSIASSGTVHTFNLPDASNIARGLMSTSTQSFIGAKTFSGALTVNNNFTATGTLAVQGTTTLSAVLNLAALAGGLLITNSSGVVATTSVGAQGGFVNGGNAFGGLATLGTLDSQSLRFFASSTEAMRILPNGNIGIGTSTLAGRFVVSGGGLVAENLILSRSNGSIAQPIVGHGGHTSFSGGIGTGAINSSAPYLRLTSTGNLVNIGSIQGGELNLTGGGTLATKVDYTAGVFPISTAVGDLNGDTKADIAVANYSSNTVSVHINNGNGTFAPKVDYATGMSPYSVSIGDLNGDGRSDIAVVSSVAGVVSVYINNGNGTFAPKVDYTADAGSYSVSIGDLNGDGKADIAVANYSSNNVSVLINNGGGTFATRVNYSTNLNPNSVSVGDFNGDGRADLAVTSHTMAVVSVLINNGNGTFAPKVDYTTGATPLWTAVGDLNGDGNVDVVVANNGPSTISVYINNGNGTFATKVDYAVGSGPVSVSIGDLSGDGRADVLVAASGINVASVLVNNGNGTFAPKVDYSTGSGPNGSALGDVNGDGKVDAVITNFNAGTISVLMNIANPILFAQASTGNVGVGTSTPARKLHVKTTADEPPVRFEDANGYCEINPLSTTWSCTSDARLKTNVMQMSSALEGVLGLNPVNFDWKARASSTEGRRGEQFGLIAQDVESLFPHLVTTDAKTGIKSVAYGGLSILALKATQEQYGGLMGVDIARTQDKASLFSSTATLANLEGREVTREVIANVVQYVRDRVSDGIKIARTIVAEQVVAVHAIFDTLSARRATVEELCVRNTSGETCIARDQLSALLSSAGVSEMPPVVQSSSNNLSVDVGASSASSTSSTQSVPQDVTGPIVEIEQVGITKSPSASTVDTSAETETGVAQ